MTPANPAAPTHLRTGYLTNPLGIDAPHPDLSWRPAAGPQRAYRIQVATTPAQLTTGTPDLWDTGRVTAEYGAPIPYDGTPLRSAQQAHWRVQVWDDRDRPSPWSDTATWETGLLHPTDWIPARWITAPDWAPPSTTAHDPDRPHPLLAADFRLDKPVRSARLYATALGLYVPTVNGHPAGTAELEPGCTAYDKRLLYATYDVTSLLIPGANAVGFRLAGGIAHVPDVPGRYQKLHVSYGLPKLLALLRIEADDGTVTTVGTDDTWHTAPGPITLSDWFGGEEYDARRELPGWDTPVADRTDAAGWRPAVPVSAPAAALTARAHPPVEITETLDPVSITEPEPGTYVLDFGVNIAGRPELQVTGPPGTTVTLRPAELLHDDGTVNQRFTGRPCYDAYTLKGGEPEVWQPVTGYHGFRYLQLEGLPHPATRTTARAHVLRAANTPAGGFTSSDDLLNGIHRITERAVQSNMLSILTDCPHREKLGWLEEAHLVFPAVANNYDVAAYYRKIVRDMADTQTATGLVPDIAPEYKVFEDKFRDDPNWGGAIVLAPWQLYRRYGDLTTLRAYYPNMRRYLDHLATRADADDLLSHGLGDWMSFDNSTPKAVTATFGYHRAATALARIATVLGEDADAMGYEADAKGYEADAKDYAALATRIGRAFHAAFYDPQRQTYATGSQAADALALDLGVVPAAERDAVTAHLVAAVREAGDHVTVGEIALPSLLRALSAQGRDDVVWDLVSRTDSPSYGYQLAHGATALTERWDGPTRGSSQNHFMLGAIEEWFLASLAGIRQAPDSVAYSRLLIRPTPVGDLTHAEAWYDTPRGRVRSAWRRPSDGGFILDVTVPPGAPARIELPLPDGGRACYEAEPGDGRFEVPA
ncbi:family 78 glycoside hydrolase catalytic domain [Streptomyces boninensis]|uniref:family 78 glycoside hydrolase catalytic domain n=1 Tax=Streptomyces boninensis TaxID=2039455 RepID=UPI003B2188C2